MTVKAEEEPLYNTVDWSSFSNPLEAVTTNISLDWNLDFEKQSISGSVEHVVKVVNDKAYQVSFDSSNINLLGDVLVNGVVGTYTCSDKHPALGTKISVTIPDQFRIAGSVFTVKFFYSIDSTATAVQWLPASATKGGQHPYVYTQCQAIHARSLLPCQDSPGVKAPYTARITAPKWCTVLMSALQENSTEEGDIHNVFTWTQPNPTSAYLIALAAGNLSSHDISPRVRIWAEPEVIADASFEFSETEEFLVAAETLTNCPYKWHRYDVLCLPPSFPYGGMENPCLTFATPTLLAGDRSLADVIAHEIAHSWTGNLVTNHTWDHFWLNEGWTVWLERKVTSLVKKNDEVGKLSAEINLKHLKDDIEHMGADNIFTCAVWRLHGEDPDDAFSSVPYEKGFNLLMYLESIVGREVFEGFAQAYIDKFKFVTVTTGAFRDFFVEYIKKSHEAETAALAAAQTSTGGEKKNKKKKNKQSTPVPLPVVTVTEEIVKRVESLPWVELFLTPGMLKTVPDYKNSLSETAEKLAQYWIENREKDHIAYSPSDMSGWTSQQVQLFLEAFANYPLPEGSVFSSRFLLQLDAAYHFSASGNAEVQFRWQGLCLRSEMDYIVPFVVQFITSQGRMKFVRPLYRKLAQSKVGRKYAWKAFEENKNMYHPIARKMVETDLLAIRASQAEEEEEETAGFDDDDEGYETVGGSGKSWNEASFQDAQSGEAQASPAKIIETTVETVFIVDPTEDKLVEKPAEEAAVEASSPIKAVATEPSPVETTTQVVTPVQSAVEVSTPSKENTSSASAIAEVTPVKLVDEVVSPVKSLETTPAKTAPAEVVKPVETTPAKTAPAEVVKPVETTPAKTAPAEVVKPVETTPAKTAPAEVVKPVETTPAKTAPAEVVKPVETTPAKTVPAEVVKPVETTPAKTAPAEVVKPVETTPAKTVPAEVVKPVETTPAKTAPAEVVKPVEKTPVKEVVDAVSSALAAVVEEVEEEAFVVAKKVQQDPVLMWTLAGLGVAAVGALVWWLRPRK